MTEATCAVLTAVYPLVLITVVLEQRSVHLGLRRRSWFRRFTIAVVTSSIVGLCASLIGVQLHGMGVDSAWLNWAAAFVAIFGLGFLLLAVLATLESEEDAVPLGAVE